MNSQAMLKANSHVLTTWSELSRKISGESADTMSHIAQKAAEHAEKMAKSASEHVEQMVKQVSGQ